MALTTIGTKQIASGSISTALIAADAITGAKIADDAIDSEHYTNASIDNAHLAANSVDSDNYVDGSVDNIHLANSTITVGSTSTSLGGTTTAFAGLTGLNFTAADASIAASIGANTLTVGGSTSEVKVPGNLTVAGTLVTLDVTNLAITGSIILEGSSADGYETTVSAVDPTADHTVYLPNQSGYLPVLAVASTTAITSTPAELNIMDGGTAATPTTVADADRVPLNDDGTMVQVAMSDIKTYIGAGAADDLGAGDAAVSVSTTSGNITVDSNAGSVTIDGHTGVTIQSTNSGDVTVNSTGGITLGTGNGDVTFSDGGTAQLALDMDGTAGEVIMQLKVDSDDYVFKQYDGTEVVRFTDGAMVEVKDNLLLKSDSSVLSFGADSEITLAHVADTGLLMESSASAAPVFELKNTNADATGATLKFNMSGSSAADADVLGNIDFVGLDSANNATTYARILAKSDDVTTAEEEGSLEFYVAEFDGTLTKGMDIKGLGSNGNITVDISTHDGSAGGLMLASTLVTSTAAELNFLDGATAGSVVNSKAVVYGAGGQLAGSLSTAAQPGVTSLGTLTGLTVDGDLTVSDGSNDFDVASHDGTNGLKLGGAIVTSTAAELNVMDGDTAQSSVTLVHNDGVVISDGTAMKQCLVSDFATILGGTGLSVNSGVLAINWGLDTFVSSDTTGMAASSANGVYAMSGSNLTGTLSRTPTGYGGGAAMAARGAIVSLNGLLLRPDNDSENPSGGTGVVNDYKFSVSGSTVKVLLNSALALESGDRLVVRYIKDGVN